MIIALDSAGLNSLDNTLLILLSKVALGTVIYVLGCFLLLKKRSEEFLSVATRLMGRS